MRVPDWLIGRHISTCTITPLTLGSDGTLTPGTAATLVGQLDEITIETENDLENIQAMDIRAKNNVITDDDYTITMIEILKRIRVNNFGAVASGFDYAQVNITRGSDSWTIVAVVGSYRESLRRGKSTGEFMAKGCDTSGFSLVYT